MNLKDKELKVWCSVCEKVVNFTVDEHMPADIVCENRHVIATFFNN